jgi:ketose-bisphosphate aldolase
MKRPHNLLTLAEMLPDADRRGYAIGSFTPRSLILIAPILHSAQDLNSPVIIQIAYGEASWRAMELRDFTREVYECIVRDKITVPVCLHLDHTTDFASIQDAIRLGFVSVMIDASKLPLADNIAATREVVEFASARGVSVEGELGRIYSHGNDETTEDTELYTDPDEASTFVAGTHIDALAVSIGTRHGSYGLVKNVTIDYERLRLIRSRVLTSIVLHGGSGIDREMIRKAIQLEGGGVSKINIATEVEDVFLKAIGSDRTLDHKEILHLSSEKQRKGQDAVYQMVGEKMEGFLLSAGKA